MQVFRLKLIDECGGSEEEYFSTLENVLERILELLKDGYIFSEYKISTLEVN